MYVCATVPHLSSSLLSSSVFSLISLSLSLFLSLSHTQPEPLSTGLLTLSSAPKSHWATLAVLDVVAQRNKPVEAPKAAPLMPFFLPSDAAMNAAFALPTGNGTPGSDPTAAATAVATEAATKHAGLAPAPTATAGGAKPSFGLRTTEDALRDVAALEAEVAASVAAEKVARDQATSRILTTIADGGTLRTLTYYRYYISCESFSQFDSLPLIIYRLAQAASSAL